MARVELSGRIGSVNRRDFLRSAGWGLFGCSVSGWLPVLADQLADDPTRRRHCILLWMNGGPSQTDTFDMKPNHPNGGEFKEISTKVPGLKISEHLPSLAAQADRLAVIRGLTTKEGDHSRGTFLMRTGHAPGGPVRYPTMGSALSKELGRPDAELPNYVSIAPYQDLNRAAYGPGFLGPQYAAATVRASRDEAPADAYAELGVDDLQWSAGVTSAHAESRLELWRSLQSGFLSQRPSRSTIAHDTVYRRAINMIHGNAAAAFDLSQESAPVRQSYGRGLFGQGCLIARRLVERGVPFVEVTLGNFAGGSLGWDTHQNNFATVENLSAQLDAGWGSLMRELSERGLLDSTTILWMGEFGRTPAINGNAGRDHFPNAWSCVLAGGGIRGGQAFGKTSPDGMEVVEDQVEVGDVLATLCQAVGVDPTKENISSMGRPIQIAEGEPIAQILA